MRLFHVNHWTKQASFRKSLSLWSKKICNSNAGKEKPPHVIKNLVCFDLLRRKVFQESTFLSVLSDSLSLSRSSYIFFGTISRCWKSLRRKFLSLSGVKTSTCCTLSSSRERREGPAQKQLKVWRVFCRCCLLWYWTIKSRTLLPQCPTLSDPNVNCSQRTQNRLKTVWLGWGAGSWKVLLAHNLRGVLKLGGHSLLLTVSACFYFYGQRGYIHLYSFDWLRKGIKSAKKIRSDFF